MSFGFFNYSFGLLNQALLSSLPENMFGYTKFNPQNFNFNVITFAQTSTKASVSDKTASDNSYSSVFDFLNQTEKSLSADAVKTKVQKAKNKISSVKTKVKSKVSAFKETSFINGVKAVAKKINCNYKDLLAVMNAESGLNPHAVNKNGGATGLIQFMPKTAERLGTSTDELLQMSATEQLTYVEKFLENAKKSAGFKSDAKLSGADLYSLVFLPGRAKRDVLCEKGETKANGKLLKYYEANKGTDLNGDGKITKAELGQRIEKFRVSEIAVA